MNTREALKALADGKKVRCKEWHNKNHYIHMLNNLILWGDGSLFQTPLNHNFNADWELYEEPKKPIDVLNERFEEYRTTNLYTDYIMFEHIVRYLNEKENER